MKRSIRVYGPIAAGIALLAAGAYLLVRLWNAEGVWQALPYLLIGVGAGLFGQGLGGVLAARKMKRSPQLARTMEIEKKDERNIALRNRAKAGAFDIMRYVFAAVLLALPLLGASAPVILLLTGSYVFGIGCELYFTVRYEKNM